MSRYKAGKPRQEGEDIFVLDDVSKKADDFKDPDDIKKPKDIKKVDNVKKSENVKKVEKPEVDNDVDDSETTTTEASDLTPERVRSASGERKSRLEGHLDNLPTKVSTDISSTKKTKKPKSRNKSQSEPPTTKSRQNLEPNPDPNLLSESPIDRLEKFRRNRTTSLENQYQSRSRNVSRNSEETPTLPKKPYSKRKRSPTGKLVFSRRVPAAALNNEEYRQKRGLVSRLPPMSESPKTDARKAVQQMFEATRKASITGKTKPKQLAPIDNVEFDYYKHRRRNKKLAEQTPKGHLSVIN